MLTQRIPPDSSATRLAASAAPQPVPANLAVPGANCWRREHAARAAFLVDAESYFRALRLSIISAERSVILLGWDVHSKTPLIQGSADQLAPDGWPVRFGDLLLVAVRRKRRLRIRVLSWDFTVFFALNREFLPMFRLPWTDHRRLNFVLDADHPPAGSHHQKVVVIDDKVAFCGGIDITTSRWDTREHRAEDARRTNPDGRAYRPFHDVQMVVDGAAAAALGQLARERWRRATGRRVRRTMGRGNPWPSGIEPDLHDVTVAIARTDPACDRRAQIREVEALYLDAIAAGRRLIYIENQYFTSAVVGDAILDSLAQAEGPEFVIVLPHSCMGWLEETVMGVGRTRLLRRLRQADRHGRLAVYFPQLPNQLPEALSIHSKVMVIDDVLVRVGSSNLSNRSMSLDTECDLVVEAEGREDVRAAIRRFRDGLIAEHLDLQPEDVAAALAAHPSAIAAIENLRRPGRSLEPYSNEALAPLETMAPEYSIIDPPRSTAPEPLAVLLRHDEEEKAVRSKRGPRFAAEWRPVLCAALVLFLAASWAMSPLAQRYDLTTDLDIIQNWGAHPGTILLVIGVYLLAGLALFPPFLLNLAAGVLFGPLWGFINAFCGSLASAWFLYSLGEQLGRATVRRISAPWVNQISVHLGGRGFFIVLLLRLAPMAPFSIVNLVIGASRIGLRSFLGGSLVGLVPGVFAFTLFGDQLEHLLRWPGFINVVLLLLSSLLVFFFAWGTKAWVGARRRRGTTG